MIRILPASLFAFAMMVITVASPGPALAHKVSVFAYVESGQVVLDAFYSRSTKVRQGQVEVRDATTGELLLQAITDDDGALRFPVPAKAVNDGLKITLVAGEGHRAETTLSAAELGAAPAAQAAEPQPVSATQPAVPQPLPADAAAMEQAVQRAVEKAMAPVRELLLRQAEQGPGMVEIVGGIGYIVGLFGVAAFAAAKRKERQGQ